MDPAPSRPPRGWTCAAAISGFAAVAFGAFAAHGVADPQAKAWLQTGAHYQLTHALAALIAPLLATGRLGRIAAAAFVIGAALFAGSLYAMALGGPRLLGAVTPLGGLTLLAGWTLLALGAWRRGAQA